MNMAERLIVPEERAADDLSVAGQRSPPTAVKVLIPIWGLPYTQQFLEFSLPTLLAPGNLPALAQALPCTFTFMTSVKDEPIIRLHSAWHRLKKICRVEINLIDDLITDGNHSTTITLAYARAIREIGAQMIDTCFILLVSDYLVADGALASVLARMQAGASGVLAGNFQIVAEEAIPLLRRRSDPSKVEFVLPPRELFSWALAHLHSATTANIVNFKVTHNDHANRLFWRVDENTLIGRFYLMHMIGIRPEVTDFIVGSSCDYSFIPEMSPSNNVVVITDSDEYLVVEMQPRDHERHDLRLGPFNPKRLASTLAEWTTARHRENIQHTLVYHAAEIPSNIAEVAAQADTFIDCVTRDLPSLPQPYRRHPYWVGAIAAHRLATGQALSTDDLDFLLGQPSEPSGGIITLLWRIRITLFGTPPEVRPFHPRWPDLRLPMDALRRLLAKNSCLLIVSNTPAIYARWLARVSREDSISMESERLLKLSRPQYMPLIDKFDACLLVLTEGDLKKGHQFLERLGPLLKGSGKILVFTTNDRTDDLKGFGPSFAYHARQFSHLALWLAEIQFVGMSNLRWKLQRVIVRLARAVARRPLLYGPIAAISGAFLAMASYASNRAALRTGSEPPRRGLCSSVFMVMRRSEQPIGIPLPRFELDDEVVHPGLGVADADEQLFEKLVEFQSEPLSAIARARSKDARRLAVISARYQFVADLLSGRHDVCELASSHPLGIRVVLPEVKTYVHDIVRAPLPRPHDSIYSFDVLERIAPEDEDSFARHVRESLRSEDGIAIIGCPSSDHDYVQSSSNVEPIHTRTGFELAVLLEREFNVVMIFSMTDDIIRPGISSGPQYFLALCCSPKS